MIGAIHAMSLPAEYMPMRLEPISFSLREKAGMRGANNHNSAIALCGYSIYEIL